MLEKLVVYTVVAKTDGIDRKHFAEIESLKIVEEVARIQGLAAPLFTVWMPDDYEEVDIAVYTDEVVDFFKDRYGNDWDDTLQGYFQWRWENQRDEL